MEPSLSQMPFGKLTQTQMTSIMKIYTTSRLYRAVNIWKFCVNSVNQYFPIDALLNPHAGCPPGCSVRAPGHCHVDGVSAPQDAEAHCSRYRERQQVGKNSPNCSRPLHPQQTSPKGQAPQFFWVCLPPPGSKVTPGKPSRTAP